MDKETAWRLVREQLTERRYTHTIGVTDTAVYLAKVYQADVKKAELAAIFHDYAKFRSKQEMQEIIKKDPDMPDDLLLYNGELWHAPVGAFLVEKETGMKDPEILNAIKYHTTGRPDMALLEKIIFLADYIEPGRQFPGVDEVRQTAESNLDEAVTQSLINTIQFLMNRKLSVYPETIAAYNAMVGIRQ